MNDIEICYTFFTRKWNNLRTLYRTDTYSIIK